jgi:hypothetical protein
MTLHEYFVDAQFSELGTPASYPKATNASQNAAASGDKVDDQDDQSDHQQKVNHTSGDMQAETKQPQNQNDDKNCPKHISSSSERLAPKTGNPSQAHSPR